jgi:hypothetical protein
VQVVQLSRVPMQTDRRALPVDQREAIITP